MTTYILDYSWARPSPQSLKDYPAVGVMRYLGPGTNGRDVTAGELESLMGAGLGVGFVWETSANRVLQGYDAGCYDASQVDYHAGRLGIPDGVPIYYAADCDVDPSETWGAVLDYYAGALASCHPARSYGEADVLDMVHDTFGMAHGWQPAATSWSDGRLSVNASMYQRWPYVMNDQCDQNDVLVPNDRIDWLWGGGDMGLSQDDLNQIKTITYEVVNDTLAKMYTGARPVSVKDKPEVWQLVYRQGELCRRYIGRPNQIGMLQYVDHLSGKRGDPPRELTEPADIDEFELLPTVGYPGGQYLADDPLVESPA